MTIGNKSIGPTDKEDVASVSSDDGDAVEQEGEEQHYGFDTTHASGSDGNVVLDELKKQECRFAAQETRQIKLWRILLVLSILLIGALMSALTYVILNGQHKKDTEEAVSFVRMSLDQCCINVGHAPFLTTLFSSFLLSSNSLPTQ